MLTVVIRLAYSIPSIILYCLVVIAIFKEKQRYHKSFYSLLIVQAVTNLIVFLNGFYFIHLANVTDEHSWWRFIYTQAPQFLVRFCTCLGVHFLFVQTYLTFFISLNRMTAILWPLKHELMWIYGLSASVLITYVTPFFATFSYLTQPAAFVYSPDAKYYMGTSQTDLSQVWLEMFVFCCVFIVVSFVVHSISVISVFKYVKRTNFGKADRRMLILALMNFFIEFIFFVLLTFMFISQRTKDVFNTRLILLLIPYASDVITLSAPYLIVVLNTGVRSKLIGYIRCGCLTRYGKASPVQNIWRSPTNESTPYDSVHHKVTSRKIRGNK